MRVLNRILNWQRSVRLVCCGQKRIQTAWFSVGSLIGLGTLLWYVKNTLKSRVQSVSSSNVRYRWKVYHDNNSIGQIFLDRIKPRPNILVFNNNNNCHSPFCNSDIHDLRWDCLLGS